MSLFEGETRNNRSHDNVKVCSYNEAGQYGTPFVEINQPCRPHVWKAVSS